MSSVELGQREELAEREVAMAGADLVEIWGHGSFPASDPPANW